MLLTPSELAQSFIGEREAPGERDNPLIVYLLQRLDRSVTHDEIAWCSAFVAFIAHLCGIRYPTVTLAARSWLTAGRPIPLHAASETEFDVVIFKRGAGPQPGPDVIQAPGHVGIYQRQDEQFVWVCGGNQANGVCVARFPIEHVLGVRRCAWTGAVGT